MGHRAPRGNTPVFQTKNVEISPGLLINTFQNHLFRKRPIDTRSIKAYSILSMQENCTLLDFVTSGSDIFHYDQSHPKPKSTKFRDLKLLSYVIRGSANGRKVSSKTH